MSAAPASAAQMHPLMMPAATIGEALRHPPDRAGTLTVLAASGASGQSVTWTELRQRARRAASVLAAAGIGPGSRVGLLGGTSVPLVMAMQAVWWSGAAVTVLPPPGGGVGGGGLAAIAADARFDLVITSGELASEMTGVLAAPVMSLPEFARHARSAEPVGPAGGDPADLALLQYTSGTTGTPRGVPVTHRHLMAQLGVLRAIAEHDRWHPEPVLSWLPLHHDLGLVGFLMLPMWCGCPLVLQPPGGFALRPASWLESLSRHRCAVTGAPPAALRLVTPLLEAGMDLDLSAVRSLFCGGEPVHPATTARFIAAAARHGLAPEAVRPGYGLAEATLAVTCRPPGSGLAVDTVDADLLDRHGRAVPPSAGSPARALARLGQPVPGAQVRVVDPASRSLLGEREVGEVEVRGPAVVGHYHGEPPPPPGSWLATGDLGYLAGGELVICGRGKDVVFAAGRNIHPAEVEAAAGTVPGVRRPAGALAFGVPGTPEDRLVVVVETRGATGDRGHRALRRAVSVAVADRAGLRPAEVITVPCGWLPRTSSGKLRRAEARRRYLRGELTPAEGTRT